MNIISNNCAGSFYLRMKGFMFENPFVWCSITPIDTINLIRYYDKLDFNNFEIIEMPLLTYPNNTLIQEKLKKNKILGIKIDNKITIWFTHYLEKIKNEKYDECDLLVEDLHSFIKEKYIERVKRIKESPLFLILPYDFNNWTENDKIVLSKLESKYKIILFNDREIPHAKNVELIITDLNDGNPRRIIEKHFNEINQAIFGKDITQK